MPDLSYDLPRDCLLEEPTSETFGPLARLAKEALENRLGMDSSPGTEIPRIGPLSGFDGTQPYRNRWAKVETETGFFTGWVTERFPAPREAKALVRQIHDRVGIDYATSAMDDDMASDQFLIFLSYGDAGDFLRPLIQRIENLVKLASQEESQQAPRPQSLRGFFRFLFLNKSRIDSRPQLILTTEGHLRAVWRKSRDYRIAIRFIDEARISFVTFLPDPIRPTQINRVGGDSSVGSFFEGTGVERL